MDTDRWQRARELFEAALAMARGEREAFLDAECGDDADLATQVRGLLAAHEETDGFLELPDGTGLSEGREDSLCGTRIGHYLLEEVLSEGGMGTVYRAQQENPTRKVAVKVMREGLTSPASVRRFEYEAQVLARLTHPHIAQVIEAGTHELGEDSGVGLPYFVLEYVPDAAQITHFAWRKKLSTRGRLQLFLQACEAVRHGHRRGVIHRDLKPENILVDASGQVKVIDFGVARATDADLRLTTALTSVGQLIGTLQYMSPEQCEGDSADLDTRADVYSLGVVLYELLCESLPYEVKQTAILEATRIVREAPPQRPSAVNRSLRGDVETIVMKALEKDRRRRYQSVDDFVADIERHLRGEVIHARPVGPVTRLYLRIQRNPAMRAATVASFLFLAVFSAYVWFVSLPAIRAEQEYADEQRGLAEGAKSEALAARDREEQRRKEAERNAALSDAKSTFLRDMLAAPSFYGQGRDARIADVLDEASAKLDETYAHEPAVLVDLRGTLAWTYQNLGEHKKTEAQWAAAMRAGTEGLGEDHPQTLWAALFLAQHLMSEGRYGEAGELLDRAVPALEAAFEPTHEYVLLAQAARGRWLQGARRFDESEALLQSVLERQLALLPAESRDVVYTRSLLAGVLLGRGQFVEAEAEFRSIHEVAHEHFGERDPETLDYQRKLAEVLRQVHRDAEAVQILEGQLEVYRTMASDRHPNIVSLFGSLGLCKSMLGDLEEAEEYLGRAAAIAKEIYRPEHPSRLVYLSNLGTVLGRLGRLDEALVVFKEALDLRREFDGPEHDATLGVQQNYALALRGEGRYDEAAATLREILAVRLRINGPDHPFTIRTKVGLCEVLISTGGYEEAEELSRAVVAHQENTLGATSPGTLEATEQLGRILIVSGQYDEAVPLLTDALATAREVGRPAFWAQVILVATLGHCHLNLGEYDQAEALLVEAFGLQSRTLGPAHDMTRHTVRRLIHLYAETGQDAKAEEWRAELDG